MQRILDLGGIRMEKRGSDELDARGCYFDDILSIYRREPSLVLVKTEREETSLRVDLSIELPIHSYPGLRPLCLSTKESG